MTAQSKLTHADLLELKRWNTPTIYNGWEQITQRDSAKAAFNLEETRDFMPQMGPMVGYAATLVIQAKDPSVREKNPNAMLEYLEYLRHAPGPKIVVIQDLDKPEVIGSFWGEVNANVHRSFGCVGTITDGSIRDVDEMTNAGLKAIAQRLCVGHAHVCPVRWNCEVKVFGREVHPGQLIHADKHGFMAIPKEDEARLLEASRFMDGNECKTVIAAARNTTGLTTEQIVEQMKAAYGAFGTASREKFGKKGEW